DLFTYDLKQRNNILTRLSEGQYIERFSPSGTVKKKFTYIGDGNGILNRYTATFDSAISYIDTITHYRYFINSAPVTDYDRNIINQSVAEASDNYGEILFNKGRFMMRKGKISESANIPKEEITQS